MKKHFSIPAKKNSLIKTYPGKIFFLILLLGLFHTSLPVQALSKKKAAQIGLEMHKEITENLPVYQQDRLNNYVREIAEKLIKNSSSPEQKFTFTIIDSPDINAFATPGGYIYIYRGLLNYMNSEAQLAAVLAHEIAHITEDHASSQQRAQTGSNILAGIVTILTRSSEVGRASALWGAATVKGYGRDMELEADRIGAEIMAASSYNPHAMMEMISLLKDHERFSKKLARESGRAVQTYHGLFSTHPRNDQRLREIIIKAGGTNSGNQGRNGIAPFRVATEGVPWGKNYEAQSLNANRFQHSTDNYRLDFPQNWEFFESGGKVEASSSFATLTIERQQRITASPQEFLHRSLQVSHLSKAEPINPARLKGHTGINENPEGNIQRLAVIYFRRSAYLFTAEVTDSANSDNSTAHFTDQDKDFLAIIRSFHPDDGGPNTRRIHYVKAKANATYAKIARQLKMGKYGEDELRLINQAYPRGEPEAGQWIKIIR